MLIGTSASIRRIEEEAKQAARSSAKVLITGESGVGKEVVARAIHEQSARSGGPFVVINCAGVPDTLLESEFFGHTRGSFTGAHRDHVGVLEQADGGTVFLDEVGEMSARLQAMLLRFLETSEIQRVGGVGGRPRVDVRVIAATNRVLSTMIAAGAFREDLYYRLNVVHLAVPPLRERRDDVEPLMRHFLHCFSQKYDVAAPALSASAIEQLTAYRWPGNVRELRNVAERLIVQKLTSVDHTALGALLGAALDRTSRSGQKQASAGLPAGPASPTTIDGARSATAARLFAQMVDHHQSFWTVVHAPFMARTLVREDVRAVVHLGLQQVRGNYRHLLQVFNLPPSDYKRLLNFLNSFDCQLPFRDYRLPDQAKSSHHRSRTSAHK